MEIVDNIIWNRKYARDPETRRAWAAGIGEKIIQSVSVKPKDVRTLALELGYSEQVVKMGLTEIRNRVHTVQYGLTFKYELKENKHG
jgi:hypothetical protein